MTECSVSGFLGILIKKKSRNIIHLINTSEVRNHEDFYTNGEGI